MSEPGALLSAIVAEGVYELSSPAHFGGGEGDDTDMAIIRHADDRPFIPGSSVAGAARAALASRISGQWRYKPEDEGSAVAALFGGRKDEGFQSAIIVDDAELESGVPLTQIRDGVSIQPDTGTALDKHQFNRELLPPGTRFRLRFELLVRQDDEGKETDVEALRKAFFTALRLFQEKEMPLSLGARTRRGYGRGRVAEWRVRDLDFTRPEDAAWWLLSDRQPDQVCNLDNAEVLPDEREWCRLDARFRIKSSLLVRSYPTQGGEPDAVPVRASAAPGAEAVLPGSALAGACRHRALQIATTLAGADSGKAFIARLFGPDPEHLREIHERSERGQRHKNDPSADAGRVLFDEALITGGTEEVQGRIHVDPFTGGVHQGPFDEQGVWSGNEPAELELSIRVQAPREEEKVLLLQVLRDLWTEDLPVGGGVGIGRGILTGQWAKLTSKAVTGDPTLELSITRTGDGAALGGLSAATAKQLNDAAAKLAEQIEKVHADA